MCHTGCIFPLYLNALVVEKQAMLIDLTENGAYENEILSQVCWLNT